MFTGPPRSICFLNVGTTLPRLPSTLPKRTTTNALPVACEAARTSVSAIRFEAPITLDGLTALSLEISTSAPRIRRARGVDDVLGAEHVVRDRLLEVLFHQRHVLVGGRMEDDLRPDVIEHPEHPAAGRGCRR